jgi:hypothetical protein
MRQSAGSWQAMARWSEQVSQRVADRDRVFHSYRLCAVPKQEHLKQAHEQKRSRRDGGRKGKV